MKLSFSKNKKTQPAEKMLAPERAMPIDVPAMDDYHLRVTSAHLTDSFNSVAWSPDGKFIATGSDDTTVRIWDAESGAHLRTLEGHSDSVLSVSWSPDGRMLASGGYIHLRPEKRHAARLLVGAGTYETKSKAFAAGCRQKLIY